MRVRARLGDRSVSLLLCAAVMVVGYSWGAKALEGNGGNAGVSSAVQAVINFYGPVDLTADEA